MISLEMLLAYLLHGVLSPTPLFLVLYTLLTSFLTLLAVSCYLHRSQTHRSVYFIWPIAFFFRLTLWLFTGMVTKEWVSVHRKHHAKNDTPEDPHSPRYFGLKKILLEGADIYQKAGRNNPELLREYGADTPNDWLERNLFGGNNTLGILVSLVLELALFGLPALIIWPIQMLVIPIIAAGFINGIAHVWGSKRYKDGDTVNGRVLKNIGDARNIPTYGLAVGEEFHNNHHAFQERYKFSHEWYEFDLAGTLSECLIWIGCAKVPKKE
jgi:stearoyl-CoA desaturase (delta-9 desaturase)